MSESAPRISEKAKEAGKAAVEALYDRPQGGAETEEIVDAVAGAILPLLCGEPCERCEGHGSPITYGNSSTIIREGTCPDCEGKGTKAPAGQELTEGERDLDAERARQQHRADALTQQLSQVREEVERLRGAIECAVGHPEMLVVVHPKRHLQQALDSSPSLSGGGESSGVGDEVSVPRSALVCVMAAHDHGAHTVDGFALRGARERLRAILDSTTNTSLSGDVEERGEEGRASIETLPDGRPSGKTWPERLYIVWDSRADCFSASEEDTWLPEFPRATYVLATQQSSTTGNSDDLLRELFHYVHLAPGETHRKLGEACGIDLCVLCLAESKIEAALATGNSLSREPKQSVFWCTRCRTGGTTPCDCPSGEPGDREQVKEGDTDA